MAKKGLDEKSLLVNDMKYVFFMMKEFETLDYSTETDDYLDNMLQLLVYLTGLLSTDFNRFLE